MFDLIDRQAAIDALEEPCKVSDTWTDEYAVGERMQWEKDVRTLNSLPTIDAVEVVRCKDCKWKHGTHCEWRTNFISSDDFCSDAERRTDGTDW